MKRIKKKWCWHKWRFTNKDETERKCMKCRQEQYWLPGHGGSEIGCWLDKEGYYE